MAIKLRAFLVGALVVALILFAAALLSRTSSSGASPTVGSRGDSSATPPAKIAAAASSSQSGPRNSITDKKPVAKPGDDWELATQLLEAAKTGNRDAQYRLFAVIDDCAGLMDFYFSQDGAELTLDEGLHKTLNASQKQHAQAVYGRCHKFREHNVALELGSAEYWLGKATQSGQPLAQAVTARRKLDQDAQDTAIPLGSNPNGLSISIPSGAPPDRRAVDLLRDAVRSLNPAVLEIIGEEQTALLGSRLAETVDRFAWIYVACLRGLDCSATSHWARDCPHHCDTSTPEGIFSEWSGDEWPLVQQRAMELNAKLDAGKWNELGLGP